MAEVLAELSSITTMLTDLTERVTDLADHARDGGEPDLAAELFTVERDLRGALRRLGRAASQGHASTA